MKRLKLYTLLFILAVAGILIWNLVTQSQYKSSLKASAEDSTTITLERYRGKLTYQREKISRADFDTWVDSLPSSIGGISTSFTKCWMPHHRITFTTGSGDQSFNICFSCDEMWGKSYGSRKEIPRPWIPYFRQLFESHGMSCDPPSSEEWQKYVESLIEKSEE